MSVHGLDEQFSHATVRSSAGASTGVSSGAGQASVEAPGARVRLRGPLVVEIGSRRVEDRLPGGRGLALFAYLALNRQRAVSRDELIDALWPQAPPQFPEAALSTVLARVRRAVGGETVPGREALVLALPAPVIVDVEVADDRMAEAERALCEGRVRVALEAACHALEILNSPLLPGLEGRWLDERRHESSELQPRLRQLVAQAGLSLGGADLASAEHAARRLVERHPYRESGHGLLMEALARGGNVAEALRVFEQLRQFLREELGTSPSPSVTRLHERLLRGEPAAVRPAGAPGRERKAAPPAAASTPVAAAGGPFVGRDEQLGLLRARWEEVAAGARRLVLLTGEPGVGKTRLAVRFAEQLGSTGGRVLYGRCDEEAALPYQPFVEALGDYLRHDDAPRAGEDLDLELQDLGRLVPAARRLLPRAGEPTPGDLESERYRLFEAATSMLTHAAQTGPLVLIADDLQWADRPTLLLLRHVLRHPEATRIMVLATFRDMEVGPGHPLARLLSDLRRDVHCECIALAGLDYNETAALVAGRFARPVGDEFVGALRRQTDGNPLFIEEALRLLTDAGEQDDLEDALQGIGVPESVAEVILRRLERLSETTTKLLTTASVIGPEFDLAVLEDLLGVDEEKILAALEEAVDAGLLVEVAEQVDRFTFCHALVRKAIYQRQTASRRMRLHHRVGEALERLAGREVYPAELAHHFFVARPVAGRDRAVRYAVQAAERAVESLAYEEAQTQYRRALEAFGAEGSGDEAQRCELLLALGRVQWQVGGGAEARRTFQAAAASAKRQGAAEQLACAALGLGERYWEANMADPGSTRLLAEALAGLGDRDSALRARLTARLAQNLHFRGQSARALALSEEAVALARRVGQRPALVLALLGRHVTLLHAEHLEDRLRLLDEVLSLVPAGSQLKAEAHQWRLYALFEMGNIAAAREEQARLETLAADLRRPLFEYLATSWRSVWAALDGRLEEAESLGHEAYKLGRRARVYDAGSTSAATLLALRREQGRAADLPETIVEYAGDYAALPAWQAALTLAQLEAGDEHGACERYETVAGAGFPTPPDFLWLTMTATLAEVCAQLSDVAGAPLLYERLLPYADRCVQVSIASCWGSVERYLGLLAGVMGRHDAAVAHAEAAVERNLALGAPLLVARARYNCAGSLLARDAAGDRPRALELAGAALQTARSLGAGRLAEQAARLAHRGTR